MADIYWTEESDSASDYVVPDDIIDVAFTISCKCLPLEHAHALSEALHAKLAWLSEDERAGIHQIYGAASGNGWQRPDEIQTNVLFLSRRQKLTLRLPKEHLEAAKKLSGACLNIDGYALTVGNFSIKYLSVLPTLYARRVLGTDTQVDTSIENGTDDLDESQFLEKVSSQLEDLGIQVKKMMCGLERTIRTPEKTLTARSLMLSDLTPEESVYLQQIGLGPGRKLGCGLFLPQKSIKAVKPDG